MKIQADGLIGRVTSEALSRAKEYVRTLPERLKGALERKDVKELAQVLKAFRTLKPGGEKQFLAGALKALGKEVPLKGMRDAFRDAVLSALSPGERQALARELFGGKLLSKAGLVIKKPEALEAMLAKFLSGTGSVRFPAILKDEMVRGRQFPGCFPTPPMATPEAPGGSLGDGPIMTCEPPKPLSREQLEVILQSLPPEERARIAWPEDTTKSNEPR